MNRQYTIEFLRAWVRNIAGPRSWFYRAGSRLLNDAILVSREGVATYWQLRRLRRKDAVGRPPESVKLRKLSFPMLLRPGTDDASTVINNIVREENGQFDDAITPKSLIDAGAYIGDTTAYFLSRFAELKAVALEPNPDSFKMAADNLAAYGDRVTLLPHGLSDRVGRAFICGHQLGARLGQSGGIEIQTTTVPELLKLFPGGRVDILKMDVEGSEHEIFQAEPEKWLSRVDHILVETHGPEITRDVLSVLAANNWQAVRYRTLHYCRPNR